MAVKLKQGRALAALNMTPLIDVVFLLLIFFLVATRFEQEDRELDVVLPSASEAKPMTVAPEELFVNIAKDGKIFVGGKVLSEEELLRLLEQTAVNRVGQSVIIRADERVQFSYVAMVMNLCNRAGIFDYTVATKGDV
ncbi:MAG TPA: biopolymer transporter ExbD [Planctomycetaceae bacterium]|nr:biopolymer transporter ExbD [Planctomycetaceae bacterium]